MPMAFPLVSCIMPTYNRRQFVPQAIKYFLRQDYPHKELIILDDGTDKICDLVPDLPEIQYIALPSKLRVGEKRNLAVEASRGELILHWDDDDWMHPCRMRYQVEHMLRASADVCGISKVLFYVVIIGTTADLQNDNPYFRKAFNWPDHAKNFIGTLSLQDTAALLRECAAVVSNDSDMMHLGVALGIPTFGVFGITSQQREAIPADHMFPITKGLPCEFACRQRPWGQRDWEYHLECLKSLTAQEVVQRIRQVIPEHALADVCTTTELQAMDNLNLKITPDWHLFHGIPPEWARLAFRLPNAIGMTVWETDAMPTQWRTILSHVLEVWLPSAFNVSVFSGALKTPIFQLPHPLFLPQGDNNQSAMLLSLQMIEHNFVFYSIFEWQARKGPLDLECEPYWFRARFQACAAQMHYLHQLTVETVEQALRILLGLDSGG